MAFSVVKRSVNAVRSSIVCQRIREQVSLRLDDELSQLELRMVAAHLERCADAVEFEASVREFTEELRAAPLQSPRLPIVVRRARRRVSLSAAQISVAATLAVAVLGVLSQVGLPGSPTRPSAEGSRRRTSSRPRGSRSARSLRSTRTCRARDQPGPFSAI